ncbi:hypothetical protein PTKIN_Ptkin09bG0059900 [Pterospermum kingtungense]
MATITVIIIIIKFLHLLLLAVAAQPTSPPPSQKPGCVAELVAFSPCLPYVSSEPNNATNSVPPQCCEAFSSAFDSGDGYCFCYILRQPLMFGFPLNETRVTSLSSFCIAKNDTSYLDSLCFSGIPALPPLPSTTESGIFKPSNSGFENDSSALISSPPESAVRSPTPASSSAEQVIVSFVTHQIYKHITWFLPGVMIFLLNYIHF